MTLEEFLKSAREFILNNPEAAQLPVKVSDGYGDPSSKVWFGLERGYIHIYGEPE